MTLVSGAPSASPAPHPPFDAELAAFLAARPELSRPLEARHVTRLRELQRLPGARLSDEALRRGGVLSFSESSFAADDGTSISALVVRRSDSSSPRPALCFLHGGGMVAGDSRTGLEVVLDWVEALDVVAISVEYRLAPEHPHPTPVEDCYSALRWIDRERAAHRLDAAPVILAGTSAGGGLAAGVALLARERGGPRIGDLILMCPMLDDRERLPSSRELDGRGVWDRNSNRTGWSALLGASRGGPDVPESAAPSRARSLAGMPPAFLDVGSVETFRDEVVEFASRLSQAGVATELHVWSGAFHGFDVLASHTAIARAARAARCDYLRRRLAARPLS